MQSFIQSQITSFTAARFRRTLRLVLAKVVRMVAGAIFLVCAVVFGCNLFLNHAHLWQLFAAALASNFLFWISRKMEPSSERLGGPQRNGVPPRLCRRQRVSDAGEICPRDAVTRCQCEPWQCRSTCFANREPENVAAGARSLSQKACPALISVSDAIHPDR